MKLATDSAFLQATGLTERKQFSINTDNVKLFDILRNSMYTDKVLAPVREYLCNALDAHTEAKNPAPFKVWVPNDNVPEWVVRDYGPGLSHDAVMNLFTTYLLSSKDQSNDLIGGFGLGSKAGFAYSDQFTVISYYNNVRTRYAMFINENDMSDVAVIDTVATTEPNGLEVRIPVRVENFSAFIEATTKVLKWFPKGSFWTQLSIDPEKQLSTGPNYAVYRTQGWQNNVNVLIGNVLYEIPQSFWRENEDAKAIKEGLMNGIRLVLHANIGDCSISPSRETLSLDKKTVAWINDAIKTAAEHATAAQIALVKKHKDFPAQLREAVNMRGQTSFSVVVDGDAKHFATDSYQFSFSVDKLNAEPGIQVWACRGYRGGPARRLGAGDIRATSSQTPIVLLPDDVPAEKAINAACKDIIRHIEKLDTRTPKYYLLPRNISYGSGGPVIVVVNEEAAKKFNLVPDFSLAGYGAPAVRGPTARYGWSRVNKVRVDLAQVPANSYYAVVDGKTNLNPNLPGLLYEPFRGGMSTPFFGNDIIQVTAKNEVFAKRAGLKPLAELFDKVLEAIRKNPNYVASAMYYKHQPSHDAFAFEKAGLFVPPVPVAVQQTDFRFDSYVSLLELLRLEHNTKPILDEITKQAADFANSDVAKYVAAWERWYKTNDVLYRLVRGSVLNEDRAVINLVKPLVK